MRYLYSFQLYFFHCYIYLFLLIVWFCNLWLLYRPKEIFKRQEEEAICASSALSILEIK